MLDLNDGNNWRGVDGRSAWTETGRYALRMLNCAGNETQALCHPLRGVIPSSAYLGVQPSLCDRPGFVRAVRQNASMEPRAST